MKRILLGFACMNLLFFPASAGENVKAVTDSTELSSFIAANPLDFLEGKVSGLTVISLDGNQLTQPEVLLRGYNSVRDAGVPLIVVDGVLLNSGAQRNCDPFWQYVGKETFDPINQLSFLASQEIESIEVLKNATATNLYGTRGANGVIIINTKKGLNEGKCFNLNTNFGYENRNFNNNTGVSYQGKSGNTKFNLSGTFRRQAGLVNTAGSNYGGFKANIESRLGEWMNFGCNLLLSAGKTADKNIKYPEDFDNDVVEYHGLFSTWIDISFTKSLKLSASAGIDYQDNVRSVWYGKATPFGAAYNNAAAKQSSVLLGYNATVKLGYDRFFSGKHHLRADILGDFYGTKDELETLNGNNVMTEELRAGSISFLNSHFYPRAFKTKHSNIDAKAGIHYDFDGIIGIDGTLRASFSKKYYGSQPLLLPAGEGWLDIHKMLMPKFSGISTLKFFGGYGATGLDRMIPYELICNIAVPSIKDVQAGAESFHEALTRVVSKEWHAGIDLSFFNNRINLSAQYYDRTSDDNYSLYRFGHSVTYKGSQMWTTSSEGEVIDSFTSLIRNKGVEVDFDCYPVRTKTAILKLYSVFSYNFNVISDCETDILESSDSRAGAFDVIQSSARAVNSLYGYRIDENNNLKDITGEGIITGADRVVLGQTTPLYNFSLGAELTVGRLTGDLVFSGATGHKVADYSAMIEDEALVFSEKYLLDGTFVRLGRVALKYNIPIKARKKGLLTGIDLKAGVRDVAITGPYPTMSSFYLGVNLDF